MAFTTPFFEKLTEVVRVDEYFIDATYKTNEPGFDLYAVLANVRGAGFPLAYMLVKNQVGKKDARFQAVRKFLNELMERGMKPRLFHTDKDWSQINAIKSVWPEGCSVRLCAWHRRKAVRLVRIRLIC